MSKPVKVFSILGLTLAWLFWELWANFDNDPNTWPLTWVIVRYVPAWITIPAVIVLAVWLPYHFIRNYRERFKGPSGRYQERQAMPNWIAKYKKFWIAAVGFAAVLTKVLADGHIDTAEYGELAIAAVTALGVLGVANTPKDGTGR